MASRLDLSRTFRQILGNNNVYYQPPSGHKLSYPCIIYKSRIPDVRYADNLKYRNTKCYEVVLIDRNPESEYFDPIHELPLCRMDRAYMADNLNHWVFVLYW